MAKKIVPKKDVPEPLNQFLEDYFEVLETIDKRSNVNALTTQFPQNFHESEPKDIRDSLFEYLESSKPGKNTTILERAGSYDSPYHIFHDLTVACCLVINNRNKSDPLYAEADNLYKVSVELLLRECCRYSLTLKESSPSSQVSQYEDNLAREYFQISSVFEEANGEALHVMGKPNIPLFSSLSERSILDERETILPDGSAVQKFKVLPTTAPLAGSSMEGVSPHPPKIPFPNVVPSELLKDLFHPNWFGLPISSWLKHSQRGKQLYSFAPSVDEDRSVVSSELKGITWLEQVGFTKLAKGQGNRDSENKVEVEEIEEDEQEEEQQENPSEKPYDEGPDGPIIKLENLFQWNPHNKISSQEIHAIKTSTEQQLVSRKLIELSKLRQSRYQTSLPTNTAHIKVLKPSTKEVLVYHQIKRLLSVIVSKYKLTPRDLNLPISKSLPVLMNNYSGTLPGSFNAEMDMSMGVNRLSSLNRPSVYRKRR